MRLFRGVATVAIAAGIGWSADPPKLLRSISGPSGKTIGSDFIIEETRNRFVYPADNSLVIYFQWEALPGDHVLTGTWRQPDGRAASISPDVNIRTTTTALNCYWIFGLTTGLQNGVWTLEVRVDGQPAGSHPFEISGMAAAPKQLSVDEIFKTLSPAIVAVRKMDESGRIIDSAAGFVIEPNTIVTAFQAIDGANRLEIEFLGGRKVTVSEVLQLSRTGDWALLKSDTGNGPAIARGSPGNVKVGERLLALSFDARNRIIGGVDVVGESEILGFGKRIQIEPALASEAAGGPLLDSDGQVVAVIGGSTSPALGRGRGEGTIIMPGASFGSVLENQATPIGEIPRAHPPQLTSLDKLRQDGILTSPASPMSEIVFATTTNSLPKRINDSLPRSVTQFSAREGQIAVYSLWVRRSKISKGEISGSVFDGLNRVRTTIAPKRVTLTETQQIFGFTFSPSGFQPGTYRVDLNWNGHPAWRTFIRVTE
jgi:hypothetical protein